MLLLKSPDVLLLDEPTNHLDLKTKDVLKQALLDFDGTLIVVSHDRDFLDGLVSKVYEFGHGRVREHLCGIYEFLESKKMENLQELEKKQSPRFCCFLIKQYFKHKTKSPDVLSIRNIRTLFFLSIRKTIPEKFYSEKFPSGNYQSSRRWFLGMNSLSPCFTPNASYHASI